MEDPESHFPVGEQPAASSSKQSLRKDVLHPFRKNRYVSLPIISNLRFTEP
jgi:hypothetical protein